MVDIVVDENPRRIQATASADQTVFTYNFPIFAATSLLVYKTPAGQEPDDTTDILTLNTNYTVTGVGNQSGGTVVLNVGAAAGDIITIDGNTPEERTSNFIEGGDLKAEDLNTQLNKVIMMVQQLRTQIDAISPHYENSAVIASKDLELPVLKADEFWIMNDAGTKIQALKVEPGLDLAKFKAELADESSGTDGARLVGYYDAVLGSMTVKEKLDITQDTLPVDDTTSIVKDPSVASKQMRIDVGAVSAATTRTLFMPDEDVNLGDITPPMPTGMMCPYWGATAPTGWILYSDGSIGNAASGATIRANADTEDLFTLIWNSISDSNAPVSGGRGASAAADFAANKNITLGSRLDNVIGRAGGTYALGESEGSNTHTMSLSEMPEHNHIFSGKSVAQGNQVIAGVGWDGTNETYSTRDAGTSTPFSILQSTTFLNWIIKL